MTDKTMKAKRPAILFDISALEHPSARFMLHSFEYMLASPPAYLSDEGAREDWPGEVRFIGVLDETKNSFEQAVALVAKSLGEEPSQALRGRIHLFPLTEDAAVEFFLGLGGVVHIVTWEDGAEDLTMAKFDFRAPTTH